MPDDHALSERTKAFDDGGIARVANAKCGEPSDIAGLKPDGGWRSATRINVE